MDFGQREARMERPLAHTLDRPRNRYRRQRATVEERFLPDFRHRIRDKYSGQGRAQIERIFPNRRHRIRNIHRSQIRITIKLLVRNGVDSGVQGYRCNRSVCVFFLRYIGIRRIRGIGTKAI